MTARPWPNRITRAKLAPGAQAFLFIPRVGDIVRQTEADPFYEFPMLRGDGWTAPYYDAEGNEIREDGVNLGTVGPGLDWGMPAVTDDDGTTRQLKRDPTGAWEMTRVVTPGNFGNLDWRNADASETLTWIGPPNRYWGFDNQFEFFYQPRIYRRGRLYATAPERVIGCALYKSGATRVVVAATTSFASADGDYTSPGEGQDFADGQVDETNMYCRIGGGEAETTDLYDAGDFADLVAQYEAAATDAERETLRGQIEAYAKRWHDLELRGHVDLIDTGVPEMQSASYPNRRLGLDVFPWHFNASGNQGQTLRRQSAYSAATLANGYDASSDVRAYRYERIKVDLAYNITTVTVAPGTPHEFEVRVLAPTITPQRIHGDRLPRLDVGAKSGFPHRAPGSHRAGRGPDVGGDPLPLNRVGIAVAPRRGAERLSRELYRLLGASSDLL